MKSPFRVAVINDEISPGLRPRLRSRLQGIWHGLDRASRHVEQKPAKLDANEIAEARRILEKYKLRVTDIASPVFKVDWPGAPQSKFSPKRDQFNADFTFDQQPEVLERSIELAKAFQTDRVRFFDFWRLDDQAPYRDAINAKLREAADIAAKQKIILLLENEMACNTATAAEVRQSL